MQAKAKRKIREHAATVRDEIGAVRRLLQAASASTPRAPRRAKVREDGGAQRGSSGAHDEEHELQVTRQNLDELTRDATAALVKIQSMPMVAAAATGLRGAPGAGRLSW